MLLVICVSFLAFSLMYMMPGDPIDMVVDQKYPQNEKKRSGTKWVMTSRF